MWVDESRYGAPGFGCEGTLRAGPRGGLGAGARARLEYVEKGFSSRPYREVLDGVSEGSRNLTGDLTEPLTPDLTGYLTADLTESGSPRGRAGWQRGQETAWSWLRRWASAASMIFVTTE